MLQPRTHLTARPCCIDPWNPYKRRQYVGHLLTKEHFDMLLECTDDGKCLHSTDYEGHGCLDAPDDIPCGSTLRVGTVGKYEREEYNKMPRGCTDWKAFAKADAAIAEMLAEILNNADN